MVDAQFTTRLGNLADLPVIEAMLFEAFFYPDNWRVSQQKAESTETLLLIPDQA
ncbi:hypothetical protein GS597_03230 [Synechococcales cyanobacterium C]|uniref:Uncharacterized protein n=1 Tax=Petrachloros mirabilis ULC683 TaxID=2781853 RepID=A0A8K2AC17_9CYAN|nr:hypothetical protein [Petrachloros mirabilis]NCJ05535.1 hypothetical protein [Petrachloros mirabilis ULC683]